MPEAGEGLRFLPSAEYRYAQPRETAFACAVGETLHRWYASNRFCGGCGIFARPPLIFLETEGPRL